VRKFYKIEVLNIFTHTHVDESLIR